MKRLVAHQRSLLICCLVLMVGAGGVKVAGAQQAAVTWRQGWCYEEEGTTVVVDFHGAPAELWPEGNSLGYEVRCLIGAGIQSLEIKVELDAFKTPEMAGVPTTTTGSGGFFLYDFWGINASMGGSGGFLVSMGTIDDGWITGGSDAWRSRYPEGLPGNVNTFIGITFSHGGGFPMVLPQFLEKPEPEPEPTPEPEPEPTPPPRPTPPPEPSPTPPTTSRPSPTLPTPPFTPSRPGSSGSGSGSGSGPPAAPGSAGTPQGGGSQPSGPSTPPNGPPAATTTTTGARASGATSPARPATTAPGSATSRPDEAADASAADTSTSQPDDGTDGDGADDSDAETEEAAARVFSEGPPRDTTPAESGSAGGSDVVWLVIGGLATAAGAAGLVVWSRARRHTPESGALAG